MALLHSLLAYSVLAAAVTTLGLAVLGIIAGPRVRIWLDRLVLATLVFLAVAALSGLPLLLGRPPADVLHIVYALTAPLILLAGRYLGRHGSIRRRSLLVVLTALALLGVIYRLFTTASAG